MAVYSANLTPYDLDSPTVPVNILEQPEATKAKSKIIKATRRRTTNTPQQQIEARKVNCYPQCSKSEIVENLIKLIPRIDIIVHDVGMPMNDIINKLSSLYDSIKTNLKDSFTNSMLSDISKTMTNANTLGQTVRGSISKKSFWKKGDSSENFELFQNMYGFLSLMSTSTIASFTDIPIFSSPQIQINNGAGFTQPQSIFKFIQSFFSGGVFEALFSGTQLGRGIGEVFNLVESVGGLMGWSPQLSPYFSFKENPFSNKPSLAVTLHLVNDVETSVDQNSYFLNTVVRNSLIGITSNGNSLTHAWQAPKLFTVSLKFGDTIVKKFNLCNLSATVTPEGVMRKQSSENGIPDIYTVNLTFSSILPDTLNTWMGQFPGNSGTGGIKDTNELTRLHRTSSQNELSLSTPDNLAAFNNSPRNTVYVLGDPRSNNFVATVNANDLNKPLDLESLNYGPFAQPRKTIP